MDALHVEVSEEQPGVVVLDVPGHGGRLLSEAVIASGLRPIEVLSLADLIERLPQQRTKVALLAYEALWPQPEHAVRLLRQQIPNVRLVVFFTDGSPRLHLGQRLWAVDLIDFFEDRAMPVHEIRALVRQAYADALLDEATSSPSLPARDAEEARANFVKELSRGFNNQRRVEDLARLLHRKLPKLVDYLALQVLALGDKPRLYTFASCRLPHEATWALTEATCLSAAPFGEHTLVPADLEVRETPPLVGEIDEAPVIGPNLTLPMVIHGELVGSIGLLFDDGVEVGQQELIFLQLIAAQMGAALRNAQALAAAEDASSVDELTGAYNRRHLKKVLPAEWRRVRRYKLQLSLAMIDIDHFKQLNDQHGHLVGDAVLRAFAAEVARHLRGSDVLVRYGGEEFLIILPETGPSEAAIVLERIRLALDRRPLHRGAESALSVTFSAGLAGYPICSVDSAEALIDLADRALLTAKQNGRNEICFASAGGKIQDLREALRAEEGDKRRFPRIESRLRVRFVDLPDFEGQMVEAQSVNLSAGGVAVRDPDRRLKAQSYALVFVEDAHSPVLSRVVWTKDAGAGGQGGPRSVGLKFLGAEDIERPVSTTQRIKTLARALVVAENPRLHAMISRSLTAARYGMRVFVRGETLDEAELNRYGLLVIDSASLRGWFGERLEAVRRALRAPGRIVVVNEGADRRQALEAITDARVDHLVPMDETADEALFATLNKLLLGEYFGIQKYLLWGVAPKSWVISSRSDKSRVLDGIREVAEEVACHPRIVDLLIAAVEEMLINAMYLGDSVVPGDDGSPTPAVSVECGTDGRLLAVSVLDERGLFRDQDVYRSLSLALQAETHGMPRGAKTASLGFHIMLRCLSQVAINVVPGHCTEVIGIVDLRKSLREFRRAVPTFGLFAKEGGVVDDENESAPTSAPAVGSAAAAEGSSRS